MFPAGIALLALEGSQSNLYQLAIPPTLLLGFPGDAARYVVPEPPCSALLSQQPAMPCVLVKASRLLLGLSIPAKFADGSGFGLTHRIPPQPPAEVGNLHLLAFQLSGLPARLRSCSPAASLPRAQGRWAVKQHTQAHTLYLRPQLLAAASTPELSGTEL